MSSMLPSVGRGSLTDHVFDVLYDALLRVAVPPGGRLNIDQIARDLSVSPTPIREALARLEAEELVVKRPLAGYVAGSVLPRSDLVDLFDVRLRLEPWLAGMAADRVAKNAGLAAALTSSAEAVTSAGDASVHDAIAALAGNASGRGALRHLNAHIHLYRFYAQHSIDTDPRHEHEAVVNAVLAGRGREAEKAMADHLESARARLLAIPGHL